MRRIILLVSFGLAALGFASAGQPNPSADPPAGTIAFSSVAPRGWDLHQPRPYRRPLCRPSRCQQGL